MGKLVRDKIPDIIRASGRTAEVRQLDERSYLAALRDKLAEEAADVLEVLISIAALHRHTLDDIVRVASEKRSERGGFDEQLWLERP